MPRRGRAPRTLRAGDGLVSRAVARIARTPSRVDQRRRARSARETRTRAPRRRAPDARARPPGTRRPPRRARTQARGSGSRGLGFPEWRAGRAHYGWLDVDGEPVTVIVMSAVPSMMPSSAYARIWCLPGWLKLTFVVAVPSLTSADMGS